MKTLVLAKEATGTSDSLRIGIQGSALALPVETGSIHRCVLILTARGTTVFLTCTLPS